MKLQNPFSNGGLTDTRLADRIDRVADIMEQKGRTHGQLWRGSLSRYADGPVCLAGAIAVENSVIGKPSYGSAMLSVNRAVGRAIARELPGNMSSRYGAIHFFNDHRGNNVVKKLREIAASYRPAVKLEAPNEGTVSISVGRQVDFDLAAGSK